MRPESLLAAPLLIPLIAAVLSLVAGRLPWLRRLFGVGGMALLLAVAVWLLALVRAHGPIATQVGGWPAPFGITLVADHLSALMLVVTGVIGLATSAYAAIDLDDREVTIGFQPLLHLMVLGVCGSYLAGDLFDLYVWFEVLLMGSFVLLLFGPKGRPTRAQLQGALKYLVLSLVASLLLLIGVGLVYGMTGTLNMADLALALRRAETPALVTATSVLFMGAFGIKAALFPLFFWLPASYPAAPVATTAAFAGMLTKVGTYALIRTFTLLFRQDVAFTHDLLAVAAALTMLTGVLGAVAQNDLRRLLSFHIISQIGYIVFGLALDTRLGLLAAIFFMVHNILAKSCLFLVSGLIRRAAGSYDLSRIGGLYAHRPALAALFLVPALALAGIPPLSGFWGKLLVLGAGLEARQWTIVAVAVLVSLLTLLSMTKIWVKAFLAPHPVAPPLATGPTGRPVPLALVLPTAALAALTVLVGLFAEPLVDIARAAADELRDPTAYLQAVLGPKGVPR